MSRSREIGTRAESAVVKVLQASGFPHAERRALRGSQDAGDVTGTPGVCWEVKGGEAARCASDRVVLAWMEELRVEQVRARADVGVLVIQRRGIGLGNAASWWAVVEASNFLRGLPPEASMRLWRAPVRWLLTDLCAWLVASGYGTDHPQTRLDGVVGSGPA